VFDLVIRSLCCLCVAGASAYFFHRRGLRYLQYLQQEDYDGSRFWQWCKERRAFDKRGTSLAFACGFISGVFAGLNSNVGSVVGALLCVPLVFLAREEDDPTKVGKVKLKLTDRAKRIFGTAESICGMLLFCEVIFSSMLLGRLAVPFMWLSQILIFQIHPVVLIAAKVILDRQEQDIQARFAEEARSKILRLAPTVIGITGSYGKTSTKVILSEILASVAPTFTTPRSINSFMGVTREIRERLKESDKFAVIEMGAYYVGSIKRMCWLTPPRVAIVTAVGPMHLERFGSLENVFKAKSELAQALPDDGILICNGDYPYCRRMAQDYPSGKTILYGLDDSAGKLDVCLFDVVTKENGSDFKIKYFDSEYSGFTKLLGKPMLSNVLAAFTAAVILGLEPATVLAAVRNVKTEANRLEPVKTNLQGLAPLANGSQREAKILRLNDAFNSNPVGFRSALQVLGDMPGQRKILVTPGMIELGEIQVAENIAAAKFASTVCDFVVVVGETNKEPLLQGFNEGGLDSAKLQTRPTMQEALLFLAAEYCQDGDIVLIENDLPDLYESAPVF
jgi:UDP-N-acetylmuramoyl-tripeptide--D-alanyl-D-alanine ligase